MGAPDDFPADERPMLSRSLFGKCDAEIKVRIPAETKFRLQTMAHSFGMTESDFVRQLIELRLWGKDHVQKIAQARILAVAGSLATDDPGGGTKGEQL